MSLPASPEHPSTHSTPSARSRRRADVGERLLDGLDALVARHRALVPRTPEDISLHAELITAEVAHELALARAALRRTPHLTVVADPGGTGPGGSR